MRVAGLLAALNATSAMAASAQAASAQPADRSLGDTIAARLGALDARTTLYARLLPSGREVAIRADEPVNSLSVIKVPIMVAAYRAAAAGALHLDDRVLIEPDDLRGGGGVYEKMDPGLAPTYRDLITQMIIVSDNTATDLVIRRVGADAVNRMLDSLGYRETRLRMTTGELFRELWLRTDSSTATLSGHEIFRRGFPSDPGAGPRSFALEGDSTRWLGRTTAREMARFLEQLHRGELASPAHTRAMIGILRDQVYTEMLPAEVNRRGIATASKTGGWGPVAANDAAIVYHAGGPTVVTAFTSQNRGDFRTLQGTLADIAVLLADAWSGPEPATRSAFLGALDTAAVVARMEHLRDSLGVPGYALGVVRGDELVWARNLGVRDISTGSPVTRETLFQIGSVTKTFTATLLMALRDRGVVGLDDPVSTHLPGVPIPAALPGGERAITLRHLATHASGLPRDAVNRVDLHGPGQVMKAMSAAELREGMARTALDHPIGDRWSYSNVAFGLLGHALETAAGVPYETLLRREVLDPLGMDDTAIRPAPGQLARLAAHHWPRDNPRRVRPRWEFGEIAGFGGLTSGVGDLARYVAMQLRAYGDGTSRPLAAATLREMHAPQRAIREPDVSMGLGWWTSEDPRAGVTVYHGGEVDGHSAHVAFSPEHGVGVIVLANLGGNGAGAAGPWLLREAVRAARTTARDTGSDARR